MLIVVTASRRSVGVSMDALRDIGWCNLDEQHLVLNGAISEAEIWRAISSMAVNKSPGIDGIPSDFYLEFRDVLKHF